MSSCPGSQETMEVLQWTCERCGREVPTGNRQVHEIRCARSTPPPPTPPRTPESPDSPNVFTPTPIEHSPISPVRVPAPWREVNVTASPSTTEPTRAGRALTTPPPSYDEVSATAFEEEQQVLWAAARARRARDPTDNDGAGVADGEGRAQRSGSYGSGASVSAGRGRAEARGTAGATGQYKGIHVADGAAGEGRSQRESEAVGAPSQWECHACTFLNDRGNLRCQMCDTPIPPEERPPDGTYRDTLIDDAPTAAAAGGNYGLDSHLESSETEWAALADEARKQALAAHSHVSGGYTTSGGGAGGGGSSNATVSDAATGSAVGALSAGLVAAMTPGGRPGRVISSMMQGAVLGGVAGAALGPELRRNSVPRPRESRGRSDDDEFVYGDPDAWADYPRQPGQQSGGIAITRPQPRPTDDRATFADPGTTAHGGREFVIIDDTGGRHLAEDLDTLVLAEQLRSIGMERRAEEMMRRLGDTPEGRRARRDRRLLERAGLAFSRMPERERERRGNNRPATAGTVASLPEETLTRDSVGRMPEDGRQCCICLEEFGEGEVATRLPCLHLYHTVCIQHWLRASGTCPQCKHRVD